jgi:hypothetical protein
MGHHSSALNLIQRLSANSDDLGQPRLRHASFPAKGLEPSGNFGFFPRPGVHFLRHYLAIVTQNYRQKSPVKPSSTL